MVIAQTLHSAKKVLRTGIAKVLDSWSAKELFNSPAASVISQSANYIQMRFTTGIISEKRFFMV